MLLPMVISLSSTLAPASHPVAVPCNPPLDTRLRLSMTQDIWAQDGRPTHITSARTLRFVRDGQGIVVEARLAEVTTDFPDRKASARLIAAYGPIGGAPLRIRLDGGMAIASVEDLDGQWRAFRERQTRLARTMAAEGESRTRADRIAAALDAMPLADRIATLTGFLAPVLRYCGVMTPMDAEAAPDGAIAITTTSDSGPVRDTSRLSVDSRTGLVRTLDRTVTAAAAPLRPMREHWSLARED